jgi:hypothetical protein
VSRSTEEILDTACEELRERETRLAELDVQTKSELDEVRRALKSLGGGRQATKPAKKPPAEKKSRAPRTGNLDTPAPDAIPVDEKRRRMREVLDRNVDGPPMTIAEIAQEAKLPGKGLYSLLGAMKRAGEVAEPEDNRWLSTKHGRYRTGAGIP